MSKRRIILVAVAGAVVAAVVATLLVTSTDHRPRPSTPHAAPVDCPRLPGPRPAPLRPTTVATLEQAYRCILALYYGAPRLDDRTLLAAGFAALTQQLQRRGLDRPDAALPELTGDRDRDWVAFADAYRRVAAALPAEPALHQALAGATLRAMVASLRDNHARWIRAEAPPGSGPEDAYGLGITRLSGAHRSAVDPAATAPLFVLAVAPGSPAAAGEVRAGDIIDAVDDTPSFTGDVLSQAVVDRLDPAYPDDRKVRLALRRPATGRSWTVALRPARYRAARSTVTADVPREGIAHVTVADFGPGAADQVLAAVARLRATAALRGVVLDVRGNGGGSPPEVTRLLGAFAHDRVTSYDCDLAGACAVNRTDDTVPLVNLRLTVLTDRGCGSACEDFTAAVRDLRLGTVVGSRTAGAVAGPAGSYLLDDNSVLHLPTRHHLGANRQQVDTIGVPPDRTVPLTAEDLSAGRDPALDAALETLA